MRFIVGIKVYPEQGSEGGRPYWSEEQIIEAEDRDDAKQIYVEINQVLYYRAEIKRDISRTIFAKKHRPLETTYWYKTRTTKRLASFFIHRPLPVEGSEENFDYLCNEKTMIDTGRSHLDRSKARELLRDVKLSASDIITVKMIFSSTPEEGLIREDQIPRAPFFQGGDPSPEHMALRYLQLVANRFHTALSMFARSINPFSTKIFIVVSTEGDSKLSKNDLDLANAIAGGRFWIRNSMIRIGILVPTYHVGKYLEHYLRAVVPHRHIYLLDRSLPNEFEAASKIMKDEAHEPVFFIDDRHNKLRLNREGKIK